MSLNPLAAINSVALAVGRFATLDEMLDHALRKVLEVVGTEAGGLYLLDEPTGELVLVVHHGLSERAWRDFDHLPLGEGLSGRVAATGEPIVVRQLKNDPRLTRMAARTEGICAFASVPLRSNFKTYGTLNVYTREERGFSEEEVQLLTSMASQIGLSVANARLYLDLKASERKFRGLVENAEDLIYLTDPAGRILYANPALQRLLGHDPESVPGREVTLLDLVHGEDRSRVGPLLPRMLGGEVMRAVDFRLATDAAGGIWVSQTNVPLRDENGGITGMQGIAQDITARRALQLQRAREDRLADLGRMAASIAHEIRNPLGAIVNAVRVLQRDPRHADPQLFAIVSEEAGRLETIVRHVLTFARPPEPRPMACAVRDVLDQAVQLFAQQRPGAAVRLTVPDDLPLVFVDPGQVRQVLWNLLVNAADATAGAGTIDVEARASVDGCLIELLVIDDGPGVADPGSALEPFFTTKAQGTGLGLAIVQQIVRDHGGTIQIGNAPGRGARVVAAFPVSPAPASDPTSPSLAVAAPRS